ncbi:FAD-dependent urate hydroxylase HpxO [Pseudanabaena sp. FACHB-2040]|uniref:FAD-dependent urate hydroxylase HpxO n=1 Tax=Pseudanabaena sp. FACHB-2040 TaxID=2692859 RepID=UPI001681CBE3|nr:FAD-dependent urate hydroxylase HpxO [Pseudanabaena sp. FACHB-2040]MBD2256880.1 FAD-dependent urate hydroxylase HpxO [Pseudanabaena sp. FACHB-2040]
MNDLKVIVIGAGIGGLTAGIALQQAGFEVEVYDRVRDLRPVGAGISLWSNGVKVLNRLGLGQQIAQIGGRMDRMQYLTKTGELLNDIDLLPLIEAVGQRPYPVARADLQAMLMGAYGGEVKLGHRCVAIEEDEKGITAIFENGHRATGDLLVAADGIHSILREHVLGRKVEPQYGGYINWNGLVPASPDLAPANDWVIYVGDHQRASLMPVAGDRFYFFFDVPLPKGTPGHPETHKADLAQYFAGWAEPVQRLIERLDPATIARPEIHDVGPIDRMVRGRVALLGDAAHATCPDLGQGGCQAMEDGLVLAQYLMTTNVGLDYALARYEKDRKDRTTAVVQKARKRAEMIHGKEPEVTQKWYRQLAEEDPRDVTNAISSIILAGPLG